MTWLTWMGWAFVAGALLFSAWLSWPHRPRSLSSSMVRGGEPLDPARYREQTLEEEWPDLSGERLDLMLRVREHRDPLRTQIKHLDGIPWWRAPVPPRRHDCWVQTEGIVNYFTVVHRCACGAIRQEAWPSGYWIERNQRLKGADSPH